MGRERRRFIPLALIAIACSALLSLATLSGCSDSSQKSGNALTMDDVENIQAFTDETMYGTGVVEVQVTYKDGVDASGVAADSYILEDRGSLNPDFAQITLDSVSVDGQTATLTVSQQPEATEKNSLVYTGEGDDKGIRERNALGVYCTGAWYRDVNGVIYYGDDDNDAYENNTTKMGYQARESLELKLRHADESEDAAACLADDKGKYDKNGLWLETVNRQFGTGAFQSFADAGIQIESTASTKAVTDGTGDDYVRGYLYVPDNYDPANGIVFTLQGQGISYWKLSDGTDDNGTGIMYDSATTSWADKGAIVVNIHDRSSAGPGAYFDVYDFVVDDANVMKYLIDKYEVTGTVVLQGNSRGTMASSLLIKALAGQPYNPKNQKNGATEEETSTLPNDYGFTIDTFVCQNGSFGYSYDDEDWAAVAATGLKVWAFDGEQDTNNIDSIATYKKIMTDKNGADWVNENVRLTGYPSELYFPWGESDHSTTRMNGWYFDGEAYYGPDLTIGGNGEIVYQTKLSDGDTYDLECRGKAADSNKVGYQYTIYDELFQEWALKAA